MNTGIIFNIQPFSVADGPGIRTTVFFKGCNLRCRWCHNPESWQIFPEIQFLPEKCVGCGACFHLCPKGAHTVEGGVRRFDRSRCIACGVCADNCCAGALKLTGQRMNSAEVMERLKEDVPYFTSSGGGVTFSGGECMLQTEFLKELLQCCKGLSIQTAVDTAGNVPWEAFESILPYTDLFLYDVKAVDEDLHRSLTGVSNRRILENLQMLCERRAHIIVRVPCVPGGNWNDMDRIASFLSGLPVEQVELLAYHRLGEGKRRSLGMRPDVFEQPIKAQMEELVRRFSNAGVSTIYRG